MIEFQNLRAALELFAEEFINTYQDELLDADANASGNLFNTITSNIVINESEFIVSLNIQEYWKYIEYGRKPGKWPPVSAIRKWIEVKPVIPRAYNGKVPTIDQLAFLIGRKIYRDGIAPRPLLQNTKDKVINKYEQIIKEALEEDITVHINKYIN